MQRIAVLSMHTSPLAQPGTGDGGGMNVYVRELSSALARSGMRCDVFTRRFSPDLPAVVDVEPGFRLFHVDAGPPAALAKGRLHETVDAFTEGVARLLLEARAEGQPVDVVHANYWLSGLAGHALKHRFGLPLVSTFHTLDRVKAEASPEDVDPSDPNRRARAEAEIIACSDAVLASCEVEVRQLVELYGADERRVRIVTPGVDHAFFSPGDQLQARRATGLEGEGPLLLFVGRIQPLKGADVAVAALAELHRRGLGKARLVIVGGPSGPEGPAELAKLERLVERAGLRDAVRFLPPQPHELLSTFYRAADCCLVPSMSESFGLVALEAAACGVPVIASAVGGLTSLVLDGETGFLVEPRDAEAIASRVIALWSDAARRGSLGEAAARRAASYTWTAAAADLLALYADCASPEPDPCLPVLA